MARGFLLGVLATIVVGLTAVFLVLRTGLIPAGADNNPLPLESWAAQTSLEATINRDAPPGPNPVPLTDANLIAGVTLYSENCVTCHGTAKTNVVPSAVARGLNPHPPQLALDGVEDDPEGETFWKIKHGIRWTGMPSWRGALSDQQIWTLALFLKHMDKLPPAVAEAWQKLGQ
jgi:thiosulfate dehydrogenase